MTQCDRILSYLQEGHGITALEAVKKFGCMRLASRIHDLRDRGNQIHKKMIAVKNRDGDTIYVAEYTLEEDKA